MTIALCASVTETAFMRDKLENLKISFLTADGAEVKKI
jgi:hypothetical protein